MAYGDPRAFAAQSMLQPLQRHTATQPRNRFVDFLGGVGGAALDAGASYLGGMGAKKLGGALGLGAAGNPGLMKAAQGGGAWKDPGWTERDSAWLKRQYGDYS